MRECINGSILIILKEAKYVMLFTSISFALLMDIVELGQAC